MPLSPAQLAQATQIAIQRTATRLNLSEEAVTQQQGPSITQAIEMAAREDLSNIIAESARESVGEILARPPLVDRLKAQLAVGKNIVDLVSGNDEYKQILAKNAQMQKSKYDAFVAAGFSEEQAFRLLEAELLGKAGLKTAR